MMSSGGRSTAWAVSATAAAVFRPKGSPMMFCAGICGAISRTSGA